jgi:hypothetical protein
VFARISFCCPETVRVLVIEKILSGIVWTGSWMGTRAILDETVKLNFPAVDNWMYKL